MAITLIVGGEAVLADRAIAHAIERAPGAAITTLDCSSIDSGEITEALSPSLFGDERLVVLREMQDLTVDLQSELTSFLDNPDETTHLVFWHKGGVKGKGLLDRVKKLKATIINVETIKKDGEKLEFVHQEFVRLGRKVTPEAVQALVDALGSDLRELSNACSQLASDVAVGKVIDAEVIASFHQGRVETTGFDVADATLDGQTDKALITLRQALASGVDPVLITSALASSIRTLAKVSGLARGAKSFEVAGAIGVAPWQIDKARRQLNGWTPATLSAAVITLADADAAIKGAEADPVFALERAVLRIARSRR